MNLANKLTMLRFVLAIAMFLALLTEERGFHIAALVLFLGALITDWIDGYVARKTNTISAFGKVADPIADKILILGAFIALLNDRKLGIPLWGVFLILARELLIGGIRTLATSQGKVPAAEKWGKWKMGIQSTSVALMLLILVLKDWGFAPPWLIVMPYPLTVLCVIVAWQSAYLYLRQSKGLLEKSWR